MIEFKNTGMNVSKNSLNIRSIYTFLSRSAYSGSKKTLFLIHGWRSDENAKWLHSMKDALLAKVKFSFYHKAEIDQLISDIFYCFFFFV